jgi:hypothetical protein
MITDTEIKIKGFEILRKNLGPIEMEKFIFLIQNNNFDYTKWRQDLFTNLSGEEISKLAMKNIENNTE